MRDPLTGALSKLNAALRRLRDDQGAVARRNARSAVAQALRGVRAATDAAYPAPPRKAPAKRRGKLTDAQREQGLRARGFAPIKPEWRERDLLLAGVKVVPVKVGGVWHKYAPAWAAQAPEAATVAMLKAARRSPTARAALKAAGAITAAGGSRGTS